MMAVLRETVKPLVCDTLGLQQWDVSLWDILEELSWCIRWWWCFMHICCSLIQASGSDDFFPA